MSEDRSYRKLTTVLAADAVSYSRLMAADEAGTVALFKKIHTQAFLPAAKRFHGRIIKLMGDGLLMEFASVVDAVKFSVEVQNAIALQNRNLTPEQRMDFRIGINIGDVVVDGDDILGNGVNVASRIEALAVPGGICVSGTVYEHVRGNVDLNFQDLGVREVKNIPDPVRIYSVEQNASAEIPAPQSITQQPKSSKRRTIVAAVLLVLAAGTATLFNYGGSTTDVASSERLAFPLPDRPSIAVLPFDNLTAVDSEEWFSDGLTEDLITDLSKVSGLFVIAWDSTLPFKGEEVGIGEAAESLGVRYILHGSVRQSGENLRVNSRLIDTTTGANVWGERFDGLVADIFSVQDRIVVTTVDALKLNLTDAEKTELTKTETNQLDAKEAFQKGWQLYSRFNEIDNARSVPFFEEAIRLDPEYGRAYGALALVHLRGSAFGWDKALEEQEANLRHVLAPKYLKEAERHGTTLVYVVRAMQDLFYRHTSEPMGTNSGTDDAIREASAAIAVQPSDPEAHIMLGWALIAAGKPTEGLNFVAAAQRLNPNFPSHYVFFEAAAQFALDDLETAASLLRQGIEREPEALELVPMAASVFALLGLRKEAASMLSKWLPNVSDEELAFEIEHYAFPIIWSADNNWLNTRLTDGLRLAAVPEAQTALSLEDAAKAGEIADRVLAIRKLGWFGPSAATAVPILIGALSDDNRRVQREAAITLGKIGPAAKAALDPLRALEGQPIVGFHASASIDRIEQKE